MNYSVIFQHYTYIDVCNSDNPINWLKRPKFFYSVGYQIYNLDNFEWVVLDPSINFLHYLGMVVFQSDASYLVAAATKTGFSTFTDYSPFSWKSILTMLFLVQSWLAGEIAHLLVAYPKPDPPHFRIEL